MLIKTNAIVLRSLKYGDQKLIVDFYTEALGYVGCIVKVSTSPRGKFKKQFFQPLTILEVELDYRERQQLQKIHDLRFSEPWTTIPFDAVKTSIGLFLAEVLYYSTRQEQQDTTLYSFVRTSLQWLDITTESVTNYHLAFLILLTKYIGWDLQHSEDVWKLNDLTSISYENMNTFAMTRDKRSTYIDIILDYYRRQVPSFPELKSLAVLHEIFS